MNEILHLKGNFLQKSSGGRPGAPQLAKGKVVKSSHIESLIDDLTRLKKFWQEEPFLKGSLISVYYNDIMAKSNRIDGFLSMGSEPVNSTIVGAKYADNNLKHIITHYVPLKAIDNSIVLAKKTIEILNKEFNGSVDDIVFNNKEKINSINFGAYGIVKTKFQKIIKDSSYVEKFDVEYTDFNFQKNSIVTIYETDIGTEELFEKLGIKTYKERIINETTILLDRSEEHTSELQSRGHLVCRLLLEKKK